jgi:ribulose-phosphate 3-epimerase
MVSALKEQLRQKAPLLSVGMVSADIMQLPDAVSRLEAAGIGMLHFDVMDGRFCPQLTAGSFFVKGIVTRLVKDVHLMVEDAIPLIPDFAKAGADIITVHAESGCHVHYALQLIGRQTNANDPQRGILRGVALNPGTPVAAIKPFIEEVDCICLLAVNPGFPGQRFIESTIRRFAELCTLTGSLSSPPLLCIDGGITGDTIGKAVATGAHIVVSGSAVFKNDAIKENCNLLGGFMKKGNE